MRALLVLILAWPLCGQPADVSTPLFQRLFGSKEFTPKVLPPTKWLDGGAAYTTVEPDGDGQQIVRYDSASGTRSPLVRASQLKVDSSSKPLAIDEYSWSPDRQKVLIFTNSKRVWRDNTRGDYYVLHLPAGKLQQIAPAAEPSTLLFAKFSPDGTSVAYVCKNNLFVEDLESRRTRQLTKDGSETIINGTSDWVNEEELGLRDCFRWSPDGNSIAYWQFDISGVGTYTLINTTDSLYPELTRFPYPKVGSKNSTVRVGVVGARGGRTKWFDVGKDLREQYIPLLEWTDAKDELILYRINRLQNALDVFLLNARANTSRVIYRDEDKAWIDINVITGMPLRWVAGGRSFLYLSERDGWRHIYSVPRDGGAPQLLTSGAFDVMAINGVDEESGWVYYIASPESATQRYLYRSRLDGSNRQERVTPESLTGTHSYAVSPSGVWALHTYSAVDQPPRTDVVRLANHESVRTLVDNSELGRALAKVLPTQTEFLRVDADGIAIDGYLMKPADFDESKKYPLLVYVYGEPGSVTVLNAWDRNSRLLFHKAMVNAGYLVASFDNRGTPSPRGSEWRKSVYRGIGVLSSRDQSAAVLRLVKERPYIDSTRMAIWGWSGGGTSTLNVMFRYPNVFKAGMAVAPVPDRRLYDTIYEERYMSTPALNEQGFQESSAINYAEGLKGDLLLVHGSGDDNVHFQGTERLVNRLIELGKPFDYMIYPNRTHGISEGKGTTVHLFSLLARYLQEHVSAGKR